MSTCIQIKKMPTSSLKNKFDNKHWYSSVIQKIIEEIIVLTNTCIYKDMTAHKMAQTLIQKQGNSNNNILLLPPLPGQILPPSNPVTVD